MSKEELNSKSSSRLIADYENFQKIKNFQAIPSKLIQELISHSEISSDWSVSIYKGKDAREQEVGTLVSIISGRCAHYFLGFSSDEGRKLNINSLLLWQSIIDSKLKGCISYDLGGFDGESKGGISHFKMGLNPTIYNLQGEYISLVI